MYLTKIDPKRNMRRFYLVSVAPTILGQHCLIRTMGRIGGRIGSSARHLPPVVCVDERAAHRAMERLVARKKRRGYVATNDALSGGGLSPRRFRSKEIVTRWPNLVGKYQPRKQAAALVFVKVEQGDDDA